jgi:hypothetical protein
MLLSHVFTCSALIPVAPVARPFFNPDTTVRISLLVGTPSGILKYGKLKGREVPMGETLVYNSTHLAICFAIISGHAGGGQSSATQYHPLSACHASFLAPLLRWLSMVDAALAAHCLRSAASEDLILWPILWAAARGRLPILLNVARWSITFQDLSEIHRLAGRSLSGGGDHIKV